MERFLQQCAGNNLRVVVPSTSGSYFHALRRQVSGAIRRPMVLFTPKSLLRTRESFSTPEDITDARFRKVVDDPAGRDAAAVHRVVLCAGKVFYDLERRRTELQLSGVAVLRLEQLYPFPDAELGEALSRYAPTADLVWAQEEPANMGAWTFLRDRLERVGGRRPVYAGRAESASPATGIAAQHQAEQAALLDVALKG
jgi:2-oxoglutarate dehydrogenase complex dehydrogenase (E1) component-like enzyme